MANAVDLCFASTVAADLGVSEDATVARVVTAASRLIANRCGRVFEKGAAIVEYPASAGRPLLALDRAPILSVASVTEAGTAVDPADFEIYASSGMLLRKGGVWTPTARVGGNITDTVDQFLGSSAGVVVTYSAGWVTPGQKMLTPALVVDLPEDLQEAAIIVATALYRRKGRDGDVAAESLGDWSVTYRTLPGEALAVAEGLIGPYKFQRGV